MTLSHKSLLVAALALVMASGCATQSGARPDDDQRSGVTAPRKKARAKRVRPKRPAPVVVEESGEGTPAAALVEGEAQQGGISWYHDSLAGRLTANGERYNPRARTCAHKKHKFGTRLRVTILDTGASAECRVNDRGPFVQGRVLDVSRALAEDLGIIERGVADGRVVQLIEESAGE